MAEERFSGVVQWFNNSKGFGFIKPDDGGDDLFVHHSSIRSDGGFRTLLDGDRVEFSVASNGDKTKALDVTGPNGAPLRSSHDSYGNRGGGGCYQCGDFGHLARDCNRTGNAGGGGGGACYNCGGFGHLARDCVSGVGGGGGACFSCGEFGHMARDCNKGGNSGGGNGGGCYRCGEVGHLARDCSREVGGGNGGKSTCYNCGKPGHFARECVEASG